MLATRAFPERHTGVEISQKLKKITTEFGISEKVIAIVHDQAANMELCCTLLMEEQGWESQKCSTHCLQLCINGGLQIPAIARLLGACRKLVGHFHYSVVATEALKRRCTQMEVTQKKLTFKPVNH